MTTEQCAALGRIAEAAVAAERETGCPAEISAAQCILESAWLRVAPENNCFGIKARSGEGCQYCLTTEYIDGAWKRQKLAFAKYASLADCFGVHARLIQSGLYAAAWRRYQTDHDLHAFIKGISRHYATDPEYAEKLEKLIRAPDLPAALRAARLLRSASKLS